MLQLSFHQLEYVHSWMEAELAISLSVESLGAKKIDMREKRIRFLFQFPSFYFRFYVVLDM